MALFKKVQAPAKYIGLSSDTKLTDGSQTVNYGATSLEADTGDLYVSDDGGSNWYEKASAVKVKTKDVFGSSSANGLAAYAAADVISNSTASGTAFAFAAVGRANGKGGYITKANIYVAADLAESPRFTVYLFDTAPGSGLNDNAENVLVGAAEIANYQGKIDFVAAEQIGSGFITALATPSTYGNLPLSFTCASGADDLYGVLVTRDSATIGTNIPIRIDLTVEQS